MSEFWKDKKVLITGHTGFKGSWLTFVLLELGADICGVSLDEDDPRAFFNVTNLEKRIDHNICDIRNKPEIEKIVLRFKPEIVFHLAAQALVRESYNSPVYTYETNVIGTLNVLDTALSSNSVKNLVAITTDKVYKNNEWLWPYREDDMLGGHDPYSSSKACCEILCDSYRKSFYEKNSISLTTVRAGNVIGGGDWSFDRLVPDIMRSIVNSQVLTIRSPESVRPWQHVLEPIFGYINLAESAHGNLVYSDSYNFGPGDEDIITVNEIILRAEKILDSLEYSVEADVEKHEAKLLKLDSSKVRDAIKWKPKLSINCALDYTFSWYLALLQGHNMIEFTKKQVDDFRKL